MPGSIAGRVTQGSSGSRDDGGPDSGAAGAGSPSSGSAPGVDAADLRDDVLHFPAHAAAYAILE